MANEGFLAEQGGHLVIRYLGTRNSIESLEAAAFTHVNNLGTQAVHNPTVNLVTKLGALAGSVAAIHGSGVVGLGTGPQDYIVGLFVNDVAGNAFESTSAAASGKGVYVCNMGTYEVGVFETYNVAGNADIWSSYTAGAKLYCSANGLLTTSAGLAAPDPADIVIGIITMPPTPANPIMRLNLRM